MSTFSLSQSTQTTMLLVVLALVGWVMSVKAQQPQSKQHTQPSPEHVQESAMLPPVPVSVIAAKSQEIPITLQAIGQTVGYRQVQVRAQTGGILRKKNYRAGQRVNAGDVLFEIDASQAKAQLDEAGAALAQAKVAVDNAQVTYQRYQSLVKRRAVSRDRFDTAKANLASKQAALAVAQAHYQTAKLNLGYTTVRAPIAGVTGAETYAEGNLIAVGNPLTTVTQLDPIYIDFSLSDKRVERLNSGEKDGTITIPNNHRYQVSLLNADGSVYSQKGHLDFIASTVDPGTGSVMARAIFNNPQGLLLPGAFKQVKLHGAYYHDAVIIPLRAVVTTPQGNFVFILKPDNTLRITPVVTGDDQGKNVIIVKGLSSGDKVVADRVMLLSQLLFVRKMTNYQVMPIELPLEEFNAGQSATQIVFAKAQAQAEKVKNQQHKASPHRD